MQLKVSQYVALVLVIGMSLMRPVTAAEMSSQTKLEIESLLNRLAASSCQFNRNGSWYSAAEAKVHLAKKLDYVLERKMASTTEQFIELAASKSSMSGKSYQVKCGDGQAQDSAIWLRAALQELRAKR